MSLFFSAAVQIFHSKEWDAELNLFLKQIWMRILRQKPLCEHTLILYNLFYIFFDRFLPQLFVTTNNSVHGPNLCSCCMMGVVVLQRGLDTDCNENVTRISHRSRFGLQIAASASGLNSQYFYLVSVLTL